MSCSLAAQLTLVIHNCNRRREGKRRGGEGRGGEGRGRKGKERKGSIIGVQCKSMQEPFM